MGKLKLKDYDESINQLEGRKKEILAKTAGKDPSTEEYRNAMQSMRSVEECKQMEVQNKNEHLAGKIPQWGVAIGGMALSVLFGIGAYRIQKDDGMYPVQAVNFVDKFRPKGW